MRRKGTSTRSPHPCGTRSPAAPLARIAAAARSCDGAYHVFSALHELLVDDFASIVLASLDMNCFLYDCICAAAQGTPSTVLEFIKPGQEGRHQHHQVVMWPSAVQLVQSGFCRHTWQGTVAGCWGMMSATSDSSS